MSRKGPRGLMRESFDNCIMFHLLTMFPNNAAEQEKYHLSNMLKKPQRVSMRKFVQCAEQLNAYVAQLPCWYYSPSYSASMMPANVPFSKADLVSHVLRMCPHQWQDQYNLEEKGMTPMDSILFKLLSKLLSVYVPLRKSMCHRARKLLTRTGQEPRGPVMVTRSRLTRKSILRSLASCARNMGARILCMLPKIAANIEKDGTAKANFCAAKKAGKKSNPAKQSFAQLSKELDKLEKTLKKASHNSKKCRSDNSYSNSE
jgi:hypothetical protein